MNSLRQALTRSLALEGVKPVLVQVRQIDERYFELHRKCASRTITPEEEAELDLMCAMKAEEGDGL